MKCFLVRALIFRCRWYYGASSAVIVGVGGTLNVGIRVGRIGVKIRVEAGWGWVGISVRESWGELQLAKCDYTLIHDILDCEFIENLALSFANF